MVLQNLFHIDQLPLQSNQTIIDQLLVLPNQATTDLTVDSGELKSLALGEVESLESGEVESLSYLVLSYLNSTFHLLVEKARDLQEQPGTARNSWEKVWSSQGGAGKGFGVARVAKP